MHVSRLQTTLLNTFRQLHIFGIIRYGKPLNWPSTGSQNVKNILTFNDGTLIATTETTILQSKDRGATWNLSEAGLDMTSPLVGSVVRDASTNTAYITWGLFNGGLYSSSDFGSQWEPSTSLSSVTVVAASLGNIYVYSTDSGMCQSTNGTWNCFQPLEEDVASLYSMYGQVYAKNDNGWLFKIDMGSQAFINITQNLCAQLGGCGGDNPIKAIDAMTDGSETVLYAATIRGLFSAVEAGTDTSWNRLNVTISGRTFTNFTTILIQGDQIIVGSANDGIFISNDKGSTWVAAGLNGKQIYSLAITQHTLLAGTDSGIYTAPMN